MAHPTSPRKAGELCGGEPQYNPTPSPWALQCLCPERREWEVWEMVAVGLGQEGKAEEGASR